MKEEITHTQLLSELSYDHGTGIFIWKRPQMRHLAGDVADKKATSGYLSIYVLGKKYFSHRLACLYMTGSFPQVGFEMDHIDGARDNNKWENLRVVTRTENTRNRLPDRRSNTGVVGVTFDPKVKRYIASIGCSGKNIKLGRYTIKSNAVLARWEAEKKYWEANKARRSSAFDYLMSEATKNNYVIRGKEMNNRGLFNALKEASSQYMDGLTTHNEYLEQINRARDKHQSVNDRNDRQKKMSSDMGKSKLADTVLAEIQSAANYFARLEGFSTATEIVQGDRFALVSSVRHGFRDDATNEYVSDAYMNSHGHTGCHFKKAECVISIPKSLWDIKVKWEKVLEKEATDV